MKLRLLARIIWGICCMQLLYVHIEDYMLFLKHPELYPIGEGEFGWICQSFENYTLGCQVAIGWDIIGIIISACYRFRQSGKILLIHFVLSLIIFLRYWLCLIFYCIWLVCDSWLTVKRQKLGRNRKNQSEWKCSNDRPQKMLFSIPSKKDSRILLSLVLMLYICNWTELKDCLSTCEENTIR